MKNLAGIAAYLVASEQPDNLPPEVLADLGVSSDEEIRDVLGVRDCMKICETDPKGTSMIISKSQNIYGLQVEPGWIAGSCHGAPVASSGKINAQGKVEVHWFVNNKLRTIWESFSKVAQRVIKEAH